MSQVPGVADAHLFSFDRINNVFAALFALTGVMKRIDSDERDAFCDFSAGAFNDLRISDRLSI